MPISVTNTAPDRQNKERGFSLLEILIVLALLGLVIAIATPRLSVYAQALQFSKKSQGTIYSLKRHRAEAVINKRGRWIVFGDGSLPFQTGRDVDVFRFEIPEGWTASGPPIYISEGGHCRESPELVLSDSISQRRAAYEILTPDCTAREIKTPLETQNP